MGRRCLGYPPSSRLRPDGRSASPRWSNAARVPGWQREQGAVWVQSSRPPGSSFRGAARLCQRVQPLLRPVLGGNPRVVGGTRLHPQGHGAYADRYPNSGRTDRHPSVAGARDREWTNSAARSFRDASWVPSLRVPLTRMPLTKTRCARARAADATNAVAGEHTCPRQPEHAAAVIDLAASAEGIVPGAQTVTLGSL